MARLAAVFAALLAAAPATADDILIFGGPGHREFLGCLTCDKYAADSVMNTYGAFGSRYSSTSIFNRYGEYGGAYSDTSPCNRYASEPPVLVDENGGFYGYLTVNSSHPQAVTDPKVVGWLSGICRE